MGNAELVALLREAREAVEWDFDWSEHSQASDRKVSLDLLARIDAALAEHDEVPPSEETVQWKTDAFGNDYVKQGNVLSMVAQTLDGNWGWETQVEGYADTEDEAKSAAIAAARGMR